ncbi:hypothetical protein [Natrarchaeobius chitinivorans]|uniref:Uncharacterized protein n=1 Tax=Natrarchaeobius chitinivorans TaxID=1679083 RepID=A0A3N6P5C8_NATCH|nr:hypothetical protein [Natrarchaeobius chitinivorans]RQG90755.1 hypothetical protein EA473_20095 [Natrarchaeobius chitinivorans]
MLIGINADDLRARADGIEATEWASDADAELVRRLAENVEEIEELYEEAAAEVVRTEMDWRRETKNLAPSDLSGKTVNLWGDIGAGVAGIVRDCASVPDDAQTGEVIQVLRGNELPERPGISIE